jgi:cephalosporin-C deacetylase-like acetyl esterase
MQQNEQPATFLKFIQQQGGNFDRPAPAASLGVWRKRREEIVGSLGESWGVPVEVAEPRGVRKVGEFRRDGYRVEKLLIETFEGVVMTANAYVPDGDGPFPGVLSVHGHWRLAKQEPVVQSRCIGLAKLGFFVLMVDAMGAGERGIEKALGEYHGEMVAGTLWPSGLALAGLQVRENMMAVTYMAGRAEVDSERLGVTGCSGGGNQTMYVGAVDQRLRAVVPVCSVGTYQAYLGAACCQCEVTPGALVGLDESDVLSLVAPRALMLVNATRDAFQFSVAEGKKSLDAAKPIFALYGKQGSAKQAVFESGHDYNQAMRQVMYGWMTLHLKGEGDGTPLAEPEIVTEEPETLRCYPGESRPDNYLTLPQFAARESKTLLASRPLPDHGESWEAEETNMRLALLRRLGKRPEVTPLQVKPLQIKRDTVQNPTDLSFESEPGVMIKAKYVASKLKSKGTAILLDLDRGGAVVESDWTRHFLGQGWDVATIDLRGTGANAYPRDKVGRAADHNTAEWSMWIGRPLPGQWAWDIKRLVDALVELKLPTAELAIVGIGSAAPVALMAAALSGRISRVATFNGLVSYVSDQPYEGQRLGVMVPGILRDVGDMQHLASLVSPRRLVISGGVDASGRTLSTAELGKVYTWPKRVYPLDQATDELTIAELDAGETVAAICRG